MDSPVSADPDADADADPDAAPDADPDADSHRHGDAHRRDQEPENEVLGVDQSLEISRAVERGTCSSA